MVLEQMIIRYFVSSNIPSNLREDTIRRFTNFMSFVGYYNDKYNKNSENSIECCMQMWDLDGLTVNEIYSILIKNGIQVVVDEKSNNETHKIKMRELKKLQASEKKEIS